MKPGVRVQSVERGEGRVAAGHVTHERLLLGVDARVHLQAGGRIKHAISDSNYVEFTSFLRNHTHMTSAVGGGRESPVPIKQTT